MTVSLPTALPAGKPPLAWHKRWWRAQSPARQDRVAMLAPLMAVLLFLAAIVFAFGYLRYEEMDREQEAVKRDVEYAQQRVRLRLLERQEQLMRLAADVSNKQIDSEEFINQAEAMVQQYPELQAVVWIDAKKRVKMGYTSPSVPSALAHTAGDLVKQPHTEATYGLARDVRQPVYSTPFDQGTGTLAVLQIHVPLADAGRFNGVVMGEYQIDGLMRYAVPSEIAAKYAVALLDDQGQILAGNTTPVRTTAAKFLPWTAQANEYEIPVSPVGNGLVIRAQAYRTSLGVVGSGLFWLVAVLSLMTAWMLLGTWRHTRRRIRRRLRW